MKPAHRRRARKSLLQAIYQWQVAAGELKDIEEQYLAEIDIENVDVVYFRKLLFAIPNHLSTLDAKLKPFLDRDIEKISPIERAILRISTYELMFCKDIPYKVVLNEAIELAKIFGQQDGHKYVNGILDKVCANEKK